MAILTIDDQALYFPTLTPDSDLAIALANAQRLAESTLGAGRPLEVTSFTEVLPVASVRQSVQLSRWPVMSDPPPVIEGRSAFRSTYGRSHGVSDWEVIEPQYYILDEDGKVNLDRGVMGWARSLLLSVDEIRATYSSGFDFSIQSYETDQIKLAVAGIAIAQNTSQYQTNVSQVEIVNEIKIGFAGDNGGGANPAGMSLRESLLFLKRYQPRGLL